VYPLLQGNPEATRVLPIFLREVDPFQKGLKGLMDLGRNGRYDVCLNFFVHIKAKNVVPHGWGVFDIVSNAANVVHHEKDLSRLNHFISMYYQFTHDVLSLVAPMVRQKPFKGVSVWIGDAAVEQAGRFISKEELSPGRPIIMYNPDAASPYTLLPFPIQAELLRRIADTEAFVLLAAGHNETGIGERLKASLPPALQPNIMIVPASTPLEVYSAMIDFSDVFLSADTGPLHIAAARKYSRTNGRALRNRTAVLSFFGATPARMSGYDSFQAGYLPSNQDAPSWAFAAGSPCRNIMILTWLYGATLAKHFGLADPFTIGRRVIFIAGGALGLGMYLGSLSIVMHRIKHFFPMKLLGKIYRWLGIGLIILSFYFIYNFLRHIVGTR